MSQEVADRVLELSLGLAFSAVGRSREAVPVVRSRKPTDVVDAVVVGPLAYLETLSVDFYDPHGERLPMRGSTGRRHAPSPPPWLAVEIGGHGEVVLTIGHFRLERQVLNIDVSFGLDGIRHTTKECRHRALAIAGGVAER